MNKSFQQELCEKLLERHGGDLSSLILLFPSLRARAFFNSALASYSDKPIWQPKWTTIDELMENASGIVRGERIRLITELFKIYKRYHSEEKFDRFYFWGDMLIADFDMIDKYLVDANQLLRNLEDIKELEADVSYITDERQLRIISFWKSIGDNDSLSEQKKRFLKVWRSLPKIYKEFRERLLSLKFAYPGLIYRTAIERIERGEDVKLPSKRIVVAGFNALSESERRLFKHLSRREPGAEFYWDYDDYYTHNSEHEAGMFMRKNIIDYPATEQISSDNFARIKKRIRSIACVSNVVQCKYTAELLHELSLSQLDKRTAIVLTDENMLIPVLHALPASIDKVNVTMGYPLKITLIHSFIDRLINLQTHGRKSDNGALFYHEDVLGILSHPYIADILGDEANKLYNYIISHRIVMVDNEVFSGNELLSLIFSKHEDWHSLAKYILDVISLIGDSISENYAIHAEYINIAYDEISKLTLSIKSCNIEEDEAFENRVPVDIFTSLIRRHLQTITVPYEGEPLEGVQIMGILETRNIDFENVILLSMTDNNFPSDKSGQPSFIPYNLRAAFGLPTPDQHEAMYAYYFYRLIQRAENVSLLYCSRADDKSTGECSRYIHQLEYESQYNIEHLSVGVDLSVDEPTTITINKGAHEQEILNKYLQEGESKLSPTALFRYIECPLKFYFHSVAKLRVSDEISDTIDALEFGNILHESMEELYGNIVGKRNPSDEIAKMSSEDIVGPIVDKHIVNVLHKTRNVNTSDFSGDTILVRDIIVKYITRGIMRYDAMPKNFTIEGLEKEVLCRYPISGNREVNIYGFADRIDRLDNGKLQVIDYKSGNTPHLEFNGIEKLFTGSAHERVSNIFQTLLYSMMLHRDSGNESMPSLYFASQMLSGNYSPMIMDLTSKSYVESYSTYATEFEEQLSRTLEELFDFSTPFRQVEDVDMCNYCDFKSICRR